MKRLLLSLTLLLTLGAGCAQAVTAFVKSASGSSTSGTTVAATITPTTAGDLYAIGVTYIAAAATTISSITDNLGTHNTFVLIDGPTSQGTGGTNATLWTYYVLSAKSGATTITVTFGATIVSAGISVHEVSGCDTVAPLDQHHLNGQTNASGTNSYTSTAVITGTAGQYIFGASTNDNADTMTAGTGYTIRVTANLPDTEDQVQTNAGSIAVTFTPSNSFSTAVTGIATFKAAGGGAPACTDSHMLGVWRCDEER